MLFKQHILAGIAAGRITLAFRRWKRLTVKAGGTLLTPSGLLAIKSVDAIEEADITDDESLQAGAATRSELLRELGHRKGTLYRIAFERVGDDPRIELRSKDALDAGEATELRIRLERLDAHSNAGPSTTTVLKLIGRFPDRRAADLAAQSGFEKEWLKTNVRKLKNLGLTESRSVGYRLSPRGSAYLKLLAGADKSKG